MEYEHSAPRAFRERVYAVVFGFAVVNVAFMIAVSNSMVGSIPWAVYPLLVAASFMAVFAAPVFWAMTRGWGLKVVDLVAWEACLIATAWFNFWCLASVLAEA
jgi:hypothetical protein